MAGLLQVTIQGASSLPAPDSWPAASHPYAVSLAVGDSTCSIKAAPLGSQSAGEGQTCTLFVR